MAKSTESCTMLIMFKITVLSLLMLSSLHSFAATRGELARYYLLHDRFIVARQLEQTQASFLAINLGISSGVKGLVGDVDTATNQGSQADQTVAINKLLLKNANTERFVEADVSAGIPLPYIAIYKLRILPQLFFNFNLGASTSVFSPTGDPSDVQLQAYAKKEIAMGVAALIKTDHKKTWHFSLSKVERADLIEARSAAVIASSGDVINLDGLDQKESSWRASFGVSQENARDHWFALVSDIKIAKAPGHQQEAVFDDSPLWHTGYARKMATSWGEWRPYVGAHMRERYGLDDGLYVGVKAKIDSELPLSLRLQMDNSFFTFTPAFEGRFFKFHYAIKTPYRNPQSDLWVSSMHVISLSVPFP